MTTRARQAREYYGILIYPVARWSTWGMRWEALIPGRGFVGAETLDGMRAIIRHHRKGCQP